MPEREDPLRRELTAALQELRRAAQDHRRHREVSQARSVLREMLRATRSLTRRLGWPSG